jgi:endonuclease-8
MEHILLLGATMPEGPSIVILKELAEQFQGKKILHVTGNSKLDLTRLTGQTIKSVRSWGKHFLIELAGFSVRVHFLMFGSYTINERKEKPLRLSLQFKDKTELNFYSCSIKYIEGELDDTYDWSADIMSPSWNSAAARKKLRAQPTTLVCDALLDQDIFAGVGNIIKNEVLFRIRVHPLSAVGALPTAKLNAMVEQARVYSFEFLAWKKEYTLREHWLAHTKRICPRCNKPFVKDYLGKTNRRTYYCEKCQKKYLQDNLK